jgi:hypothetical protein
MKRWKLMLAAALGLGVADCGDDTHPVGVVEYGPAMSAFDLSATPDLAPHDAAEKD